MKKTMTMALALVGIAGFVLVEAQAFSIETAPAGYLEKTGSGQIWSSSTYVSFTNAVNKLSDIGVNDSFVYNSDFIRLYDNDGKLLVSATYFRGSTEYAEGWYDKSQYVGDRELPLGAAICFVKVSDNAALVFSGKLKSDATTLTAPQGHQTWVGNVNPLPAGVRLGDITAANFKFRTDWIQVYDANGVLALRATYLDETLAKTYSSKLEKAIAPGWYTSEDVAAKFATSQNKTVLSPGQGFVILPASANVSVTIPGI